MSHDTGADVDELLTMSRPELDRLFRASHPGEIRRGEGRGTVATARGAKVCKTGKIFGRDGGGLRNRVTPFGIRAIRAKATGTRACWTAAKALSWTVPAPRLSRTGYVTRFARSAPVPLWESSAGGGVDVSPSAHLADLVRRAQCSHAAMDTWRAGLRIASGSLGCSRVACHARPSTSTTSAGDGGRS